MKVTELLTSLPIGEVIPKKVLSVLKRNGLIYDYSNFGYLESQWVYYFDCEGKRERHISYAGKEIKDGELGSFENPFKNYRDSVDHGFGEWLEINYKGFTLSSKYLSGCFNAYLIKRDGETKDNKKVERSMVMHLM
jgi:hypothetical protein